MTINSLGTWWTPQLQTGSRFPLPFFPAAPHPAATGGSSWPPLEAGSVQQGPGAPEHLGVGHEGADLSPSTTPAWAKASSLTPVFLAASVVPRTPRGPSCNVVGHAGGQIQAGKIGLHQLLISHQSG